MKTRYLLSAASLSVLLITAASPASAADDKLEQLKEQGFARIAIANEPPFTAVGADGKVSGAAPMWRAQYSKSWASRKWSPRSRNMAQ